VRSQTAWWAMEGSNLRPPRCERGALTTELTAPCLWDKINYRHSHAHAQASGGAVCGRPAMDCWQPSDLKMKVDQSNLVKLNQMLSCRTGGPPTDFKRKFDSYLLVLRTNPSIV
jgi:hypothetical protein